MVINGATTANAVIWSQTVNVVENTYYQFTYWVQTVVNGDDPAPSQLQFFVNGVESGPIYTANATTGLWTKFLYNWSSGSNSTAVLSLVNMNTIAGGNDFALDDIVFQHTCVAEDDVTVNVNDQVAAGAIANDQTICRGYIPASLTSSTGGTGLGTITYEWQNSTDASNWTTVTGENASTYAPGSLDQTTYFRRRTVSVYNGTTCYSAYTSYVTITVDGPTVEAGGPDEICESSSPSDITLTGASFGGGASTAAWSIVSGGGTLSSTSQTASPETVTYTPEADYSGTVLLQLTTDVVGGAGGCSAMDEREITITPQPTASAGGSETICPGGSATVSGASAANGSILWTHNGVGSILDETTLTPTYNPGAGDLNNTVTLTITVTGSGGCSAETATAFYSVTVEDTENPTISVSQDTIVEIIEFEADAPVYVDIASQSTTTANDNCSVTYANDFAGRTSDTDASGNYPLGETLVTWTATDGVSNTGTAQQRVVVAAFAGLEIICCNDSTIECDPASILVCTPTYNEYWPWVRTDTGNDYPGTETGGPCIYTTTVRYWAEWKVFGIFGSVRDTCEVVYTYYKDTTDPSITCRTDTTVNTGSGNCNYTVPDTRMDPVTYSDNCAIDSVYNDFNNTNTLNGEQIPIGVDTIRWIAVDSCGNRDTCSFVLTVVNSNLPVITTQPADPAAVCEGNGTIAIEALVSGSGLSYQWYSGSTPLSGSPPYSGVTGNTLTITNPGVSLNGEEYHLIITESTCSESISTDTVSITVNALPNDTYTMSDATICRFGSASLTLSGSESGVDYQLRDESDDSEVGSPVAGTGSFIQFTNLSPEDTTTYNVLATNTTSGCEAEMSDLATINVLFFNAAVWNITGLSGSDSINSEPASSPDICPELDPGYNLYPFNPDDSDYKPGSSWVVFRVDRDSSLADWQFDFEISGTDVIVVDTIASGLSAVTLQGTNPMVNAGNNDKVYIRFQILNIPETPLDITFNVENVQDTDNSCSETGNFDDNDAYQTINPMPDVGPFD
jgi:hypothetical protein